MGEAVEDWEPKMGKSKKENEMPRSTSEALGASLA